MRLLVLLATLTTMCATTTLAFAQGNPLGRPQTLPRRVFRIDAAPSDFGFMDHGELNSGRGFRVRESGGNGDAVVELGMGFGYGIGRAFEFGALVLPLRLSPDSDIGDMEAYGRYALGRGIALQGTLQLPTETDLGLGFGVPMRFGFGRGDQIQTGVELEVIFADDARVNLDVPLAFQFAVSRSAYVGVRTGLLFADMEEMMINLGAQAGVGISRAVDLSMGFNWPLFLWTGPGDSVNLDVWELIVGLTVFA